MLRVYFLSLLLPLLAGAQSAVTLTRAKAHFKQGAAFYNAGLYDRAINAAIGRRRSTTIRSIWPRIRAAPRAPRRRRESTS